MSDQAQNGVDMATTPPVVTLCGSTRFRDEFLAAARKLTLAGEIVLMPGVFGHADGIELDEQTKRGLDALHLRKIDLSRSIFVVNPGGYIGDSTRAEIKYAEETGKAVYYSDCPTSKDGLGHCRHWWDDDGPCCWCQDDTASGRLAAS